MKIFSAAEAAALATPGDVVHIAGCCGEPSAILDAVSAEPGLWRDIHLVGAFIPGINDRDLAALGQRTTVSTIFANPGLRQDRAAGHVRHWPLNYTEYCRFLETPDAVQIAYAQVTPPRRDGTVSFGMAPDFGPALLPGPARLIGLINPAMPDPVDGPRVPVERFEGFVEVATPLIEYDAGTVDEATAAIGRTVASQLAPGDTLQLGLGKVQAAVLQHLLPVEDLGYHGGMISTPILDPLRRGVFARGVITGVALGSKEFYREVAESPLIRFAPVGYTHSIHTLANIPRFVSVNSVIEVDLFGQANAESMGRQRVSGQGGLVDFVRGARASRGGRSILALSSTASNGKVSRIVASLAPWIPASVARADVDTIVTEHGVADLRFASIEERAERIIAIADPKFRQTLANQWKRRRRATRQAVHTGNEI